MSGVGRFVRLLALAPAPPPVSRIEHVPCVIRGMRRGWRGRDAENFSCPSLAGERIEQANLAARRPSRGTIRRRMAPNGHSETRKRRSGRDRLEKSVLEMGRNCVVSALRLCSRPLYSRPGGLSYLLRTVTKKCGGEPTVGRHQEDREFPPLPELEPMGWPETKLPKNVTPTL